MLVSTERMNTLLCILSLVSVSTLHVENTRKDSKCCQHSNILTSHSSASHSVVSCRRDKISTLKQYFSDKKIVAAYI